MWFIGGMRLGQYVNFIRFLRIECQRNDVRKAKPQKVDILRKSGYFGTSEYF